MFSFPNDTLRVVDGILFTATFVPRTLSAQRKCFTCLILAMTLHFTKCDRLGPYAVIWMNFGCKSSLDDLCVIRDPGLMEMRVATHIERPPG